MAAGCYVTPVSCLFFLFCLYLQIFFYFYMLLSSVINVRVVTEKKEFLGTRRKFTSAILTEYLVTKGEINVLRLFFREPNLYYLTKNCP